MAFVRLLDRDRVLAADSIYGIYIVLPYVVFFHREHAPFRDRHLINGGFARVTHFLADAEPGQLRFDQEPFGEVISSPEHVVQVRVYFLFRDFDVGVQAGETFLFGSEPLLEGVPGGDFHGHEVFGDVYAHDGAVFFGDE